MKKEYGINNKPNLNLARKRLGKETKVIDFMPGQSDEIDKGGTLRLGS